MTSSQARADHVLMLMLVVLCVGTSSAQAQLLSPSPSPTPAAAPAPAPAFCNITQIIESAGEFTVFLHLLSATQAGEGLQTQANQTNIGITVFAPTDKAFAMQPAATLLKGLTEQQEVSLIQFHALTKWYSLAALQQADNTMLSTYATNNGGGAGKYALSVSDYNGTIALKTEWSDADIVSTLYNADPCSVFAIDEVLLPVEIFGTPLPTPTPAPPASNVPASLTSSSSSDPASSPSSSSSGPASSQISHAPPSPHYMQALAFISLFFCNSKLFQ